MRVLVAADGSPHCLAGTELLARMPLPKQTQVTLLSVEAEAPEAGRAEADAEDELRAQWRALRTRLRQDVDRSAAAALGDCATRLQGTGWTVRSETRQGVPIDRILEAAREIEAELIVVGARGRSRLESLLLGSVSARVAAHAPCSVLLGRPRAGAGPAGPQRPGLRVLLAVDPEDGEQASLDRAASLRFAEDDRIELVTVLRLSTLFGMDLLEAASGVLATEQARAGRSLEALARRLAPTAARVQTRVRSGSDVLDEVTAAARELGADLVMLGSEPDRGLSHCFLGGLPSRVAHHAPCSVWLERG